VKVIKNINNNVSVCQDANGKELIAFGKGIGFKEAPYEIQLSQIERTYYNVDSIYISMINDLPEEIIAIADEIVNYSRSKINYPISSNIIFTLADHINFSIHRYQKNIKLNLPVMYDVQQLFDTEMEIGKYGLHVIRNKLKVRLPKEEAVYIALHLINAKLDNGKSEIQSQKIIDDATKIIEKDFELTINKEDFNYSRFVSHMNYLIQRCKRKEVFNTDNNLVYTDLIDSCPRAYKTTKKVSKYLESSLEVSLTDEEKLYLVLHINRLCTREDCYQ